MPKKILVLSPQTFSSTGGIQSMSRTLAYVLNEWCQKNKWAINLYVLNDPAKSITTPYLPSAYFKGFRRNKIWFTLRSIWKGINADILIINHINLSFPALVIHLFNPSCKIWLIAHGTEVWRSFKGWRRLIWKIADHFICVSSFTKYKVIELHLVKSENCSVLNNIPDPFLKLPENFRKPAYLLARYGLNQTDKVILTLTRITANERVKGYDQVMRILAKIRLQFPNLVYVLAGPLDECEKERIEKLAASLGLSNNFILTGYIKPTELTDHYLLANIFVLPSKKEGFGIVFTEAMIHGLPVICGNKDGSTDAIRNKIMGTAIDPDDVEGLELAIRKKLQISLTAEFRKQIQSECLKQFDIKHYTSILAKMITNV